jgi:hypothetical protein
MQSCWMNYNRIMPLPNIDKHRSLPMKGKLSPCLSMNMYERVKIKFHILNLDNSIRWVVSLTVQSLYSLGSSSCWSLNRRLGGLQSQSGCYGDENIPPPAGNLTLITQPFASHFTDYAMLWQKHKHPDTLKRYSLACPCENHMDGS